MLLAAGTQDTLVGLALIIALGVGAQWLAWRIRIPSILMLLAGGLIVGPGSTLFTPDGRPLLDPNELLGQDLLLSLVSLSVALILYEGGLTLRLGEISGMRGVIGNLVTLGAAITWCIASVGAYFILGLPWGVAVLLGAVMIVTGPTVVGPLLNHIRPVGAVGRVLKWEGIVIDPIGALAAVLVFEVIRAGPAGHSTGETLQAVAMTIVVGGGLGVAAALILMTVIKRFWVPEELQNPVSLLLVVVVFVVCDVVQKESGLLAATVMGIVLANQTSANVMHIIEFKENLRVLLISSLFVVLGARLAPSDLASLGWPSVLFVLLLIVVVRPLAVLASTAGSGLKWPEKVLLAWVAPRGIVAAAVASVFGIALAEGPLSVYAAQLVPVTFAVIVGTVAVYGLSAAWVAQRLGLADQNPQGLVILGAHAWGRAIASVLHKRGIRVLLIDTNHDNTRSARMSGLPTWSGNILAEYAMGELDLTGMGRLLALTPNDEVNVLAVQRFRRVFAKRELYQVAGRSDKRDAGVASEYHGRSLFADDATFAVLASRIAGGHVIKGTTLSDEFTYDDYRTLYGPRALVMFIVGENRRLTVVTAGSDLAPGPGQTLISLIDPDDLLFH